MISAPIAITVVSLDGGHLRILWTHPPTSPGTCAAVRRGQFPPTGCRRWPTSYRQW